MDINNIMKDRFISTYNAKIIVLGSDHHNTLGVIRGLGERGLMSDLILVDNGRCFVDKSKYIKNSWKVSCDTEAIRLLKELYANERTPPVVICCSDALSGLVDEHHDELQPLFRLPGANLQGRIAELMNKKSMSDLAIEIGLTIPPTYYLKDDCKGINQISLPCIIKPMESRKGRKSDIQICRNQNQLSDYINHHDVNNIQIQAFIDKDFEYQLIGCATKDEIIIPGVSKILRPCKGSNTSFLHYIPLEEGFCEIEKCYEYVRRTGYHGLFSMEFLRDKQGKDYFMEINFRNDGNAICVTAAGISLPYIWYLDCIGEDFSKEVNKPIRSVYVMPDVAELKLLFTGQINPWQFISDLWKTDRFMEYDKNDKKPFWALVRKKILR